MKSSAVPKIIFIIFVVALTLSPLTGPGLFDVHDPTSAYRLSTWIETVKSGQFPPAWTNLLNFGFGYPIHLYYAPLATMLSAIFFPFVNSYEWAVKLALVTASLVGSFGVYRLLVSRGKYLAVLGSVAFTLLPYRASALYVRGSYSEYLAMSLIPWVIYAWTTPLKTKYNIVCASLLTACLFLAHNTLPLILAPILVLIIYLYQSNHLKYAVYTLGLSVALSAWFLFPVIFERGFIQVETVARITDYRDHFLAISQLWYSPWGYGGSSVGVMGDSMSFMVGKGQLVLALIGAVVLYRQKTWSFLITLSTIVLVSLYLSLPISEWVYQLIPQLQVIQFPWRTLALLGVGVSVLAAYAVSILPKT
jgi:hypothetical protein